MQQFLKEGGKNASGYIRSRLASTEEQARHGISIEAQLEALRGWAKREGHAVVGEYVDAGISGKKPPAKRPELSRFFADLEADLKVDVLAFCKLDRFFRSVKLYYQAMDVLDAHGVAWEATQEDLETITTNGRFKVNLLLAIAEQEADRTSDRIKAVFDHKRAKGEVTGGDAVVPLGYRVQDKRPVLSEKAVAVRGFFEHYLENGSIHAAMDYMHTEWGIPIVMATARRMIKNPAYKGWYGGVPDSCPAIITAEEWNTVQDMAKARSCRHNPTGNVYLFSGLLVCGECGHKLVGLYNTYKATGKQTYYYRCQRAYICHMCPCRSVVSEIKLEAAILSQLDTELALLDSAAAGQQPKIRKAIDTAAIKRKLDRLKDLYVDDLITKEQYKADYDRLQAQLSAAARNQAPAPLAEKTREIIAADFASRYKAADRQKKRSMLLSIIDHIDIDKQREAHIFFKV